MLKLFVVLLGGRATGCFTELHDVVFAVGNSLGETYPTLVNKWFGIKKRLHIDCSIELTHVDGHDIRLSRTKPPHKNKKLYYVNFGGYQANYFGEIHHSQIYVAATKTQALQRAKKELALALIEPHCDDNLDIDDILAIDKIDEHYICLEETTTVTPLTIVNKYRRLDLPAILTNANQTMSMSL